MQTNIDNSDIEYNSNNGFNEILKANIEEYKRNIGTAIKNLDKEQQRLHDQYIKISIEYYNGSKTLADVFSFLENNIEYEIVGSEKLQGMNTKRGIFIANHPYTSQELWLDTKAIHNSIKGEPKYDQLHAPILRSFLRDKLLKDIPFKTFVDPIGYSLAQSEMNNIDLPTEKKYEFIKNFLIKNKNESAFLFPEGGYKNGAEFHKGFYRIAKDIDSEYIITIAITDYLSLFQKNKIHVINVHTKNERAEQEEQYMIERLRNEIFHYKNNNL